MVQSLFKQFIYKQSWCSHLLMLSLAQVLLNLIMAHQVQRYTVPLTRWVQYFILTQAETLEEMRSMTANIENNDAKNIAYPINQVGFSSSHHLANNSWNLVHPPCANLCPLVRGLFQLWEPKYMSTNICATGGVCLISSRAFQTGTHKLVYISQLQLMQKMGQLG